MTVSEKDVRIGCAVRELQAAARTLYLEGVTAETIREKTRRTEVLDAEDEIRARRARSSRLDDDSD